MNEFLLSSPKAALVYNSLVFVQVSAYNINGWSVASVRNTVGARVKVVPTRMNDVTRGSLTSETQIELTWSPITIDADTGGSQIISYNV